MSFRSVDDPERLKALIEAILLLEVEMELPKLLRHIVDSAVRLSGATYGALGVLDDEGKALAQFITVGLDAEAERAIGDRPAGMGVLGLLIVDPVRSGRPGSPITRNRPRYPLGTRRCTPSSECRSKLAGACSATCT